MSLQLILLALIYDKMRGLPQEDDSDENYYSICHVKGLDLPKKPRTKLDIGEPWFFYTICGLGISALAYVAFYLGLGLMYML